MTHYVNPLLHPLISTTPTLPSAPLSPPSSSTSPSPYLHDTVSSTPDLPIAARFLRPSMSDLTHALPPSPVDEHGRLVGWRESQMPDMDGSDSGHSGGPVAGAGAGVGKAGRHSLPAMTREQQGLYATTSSHASLASTLPAEPDRLRASGRLSSFNFRSRHPLRPAASGTKLHKGSSQVPAEVLAPPPVPQALRDALEAVAEMLAGHEDLSAKLKEQWARAFPLVRGLAAIWSDQPWFLQVYARYILALEEALALLDLYLPSTHTPPSTSYFGGSRKVKTPGLDKEQRKLAKVLMRLEERAAEAGESSLSICLSKPLMRLGKLPLLMQNLLYHTDGVALEWEQTRAMALEVDALVRSIEDEKVEEEEREKTRDALARIEGINDKVSSNDIIKFEMVR